MTYLPNFQNMIIMMIIVKHGLTTAKMNITRKRKNKMEGENNLPFLSSATFSLSLQTAISICC